MNEKCKPLVSVVIIGLNEEKLLGNSLAAVIGSKINDFDIEIIYVDSGSIDRSLDIANSFSQVTSYKLSCEDVSAAKARNLGAKQAKGTFIQFVDGDSELDANWLTFAYRHLSQHSNTACVFGALEESHPESNIYTKVCSFDWYIPPGEYRLCGGNAFWRKSYLEDANFFDETLSAGEEPDLCYRVRQLGGRIFCIDAPMVKHDLEMNSFVEYWQRGVINGKAYAAIGLRYRNHKEKLWFKEMLRNFLEPLMWLSILCVVTYLVTFSFAVVILCLLWLFRAVKIAISSKKKIPKITDGILYGFHIQFIRLASFWGQLKFLF